VSVSFEEVLERLERVRRRGEHATARCPAHQDRHSSLSIGVGSDARILLHCFAGCQTEAIVAAIGCTISDLFPDREGEGVCVLFRRQQCNGRAVA
jgi:hypothetical protein